MQLSYHHLDGAEIRHNLAAGDANIIETTGLGAMRQRGISEEAKPDARISFPGGAKNFFYKGTNGRWQGVLTEAELTLYEQVQANLLPPDCAHWLELGGWGWAEYA